MEEMRTEAAAAVPSAPRPRRCPLCGEWFRQGEAGGEAPRLCLACEVGRLFRAKKGRDS